MNAVARLVAVALVPFAAGWVVGAVVFDRTPDGQAPAIVSPAGAVGADGSDVAARNGSGQRLGLWDLIASAPARDLRHLASAAAALNEPHRYHALRLVAARWLAVDASAAAEFFRTEPGLEPFLPDFYEAWIRLDPRGFARDVEFPLGVGNSTEILAQLALTDLELAEGLAAHPASGTTPEKVLKRVAEILERIDADAEFALAMEDPATAIDEESPGWGRVFAAWLRQEPALAIDYGIRKLEEGDGDHAVDWELAESLLSRWDTLSDEQLARALTSAPGSLLSDGFSFADPFQRTIEPDSIPLHRLEAAIARNGAMDPGANPKLAAFMAAAYGAEDPSAGVRFLDGLGDDGTAHLDAAKAFFNAWRTRDAEAACEWAAEQPPLVLLSLARALPGADHGFDEMAPDPFRTPPPRTSQLGDAENAMVGAARVAFDSMDPELLSTHLSDSLPLLRIMPESFTGLLQTRPEGVDPSDYRVAATLLVRQLAQDDPAGAMQWLADLADPAVRDSVTKEVLLDAFDADSDPFADPSASLPPQAPIEYARALDPAEREAFVATALALAAPVDEGPFGVRGGDLETIERLETLISEVDLPPATRGEFFEQLDRVRAGKYSSRGEGG